MGAGHSHEEVSGLPSGLARVVVLVLVPFVLLTGVGLVLLWPTGQTPTIPANTFYEGTVQEVRECDPPIETCGIAVVSVDEGPDAGTTSAVQLNIGPATPEFDSGTPVYLVKADGAPEGREYALVDIRRGQPLFILAALFAVAVVLLAGWKGVSALVGLGASLTILAVFVLPALLQGSPPLAVAAVGAATIAVVSMGFAHGLNVRTGIALVGTLIALTITALLGAVFTQVMNFTGIGSDDAAYLQAVAGTIDLRGLLLAGLVIGALGVLDDVTVTQAAAVWEVFGADRSVSLRDLFASGMRVGRDHVAATVNTLVLAYVGASLPLFLLITMSEASLVQSMTNEAIAAEIVRSLVGALGIVAAVPITTFLAAVVLVDARRRAGDSQVEAAPAQR